MAKNKRHKQPAAMGQKEKKNMIALGITAALAILFFLFLGS
jgi:hypothetical protein